MKKSLLWKIWTYPDHNQKDFMNHFLKNNWVKNHESFFEKKYPQALHSEDKLKDIQIAIDRIKRAIIDKEKIIIFWDYDCDWIPWTAICVETLQALKANVSYRIPDRENDWYGLKNYLIDEIKKTWASLIITVDNWISAINEVKYANELWIDIIITDHHEVWDSLPEAFAIVNPLRKDCDYPFKNISGACVAWKLMIWLAKKINWEPYSDLHVRDKYVDLVALSTVTDIMPLIDENRVIVSKWLEKIAKTRNIWIQEIFKEIKVNEKTKYDADFFWFSLGPRINAAGRMASPYYALQLLLWNKDFASILEKLNSLRKIQVEIAIEQVEKSNMDLENVVILSSKKWKSWIIGLIAWKITEKYNTPSIIMQEKEWSYVWSCRAPIWFNMYNFLSQFSNCFSHFWGHAQACWFSMEKWNFEVFEKLVLEKWKQLLLSNPLINNLDLTYILNEWELSIDFTQELEKFEPFWNWNKKPIFLIKDINNNFNLVWHDKSHMLFKFWWHRAIWFWLWRFENILSKTQNIDLAVTLWIQFWNWKKQMNIQVKDIMISSD